MAEEQARQVSIEGRIDVSAIEDRKFESAMRVAAVRGGEVLASAPVTGVDRAGRYRYELDFKLLNPCTFHLILGRADVSDRVLVASELARVAVTPAMLRPLPPVGKVKADAAIADRVKVEVADMVVDAARYAVWLGFCRTYRVKGRVVCRHWKFENGRFRFCDDPVPGATVEVYDVDSHWWFYSKDLVTTATTAFDGTFEATFTWCCLPLRPWLERPWHLDPEIFERVRRAVDKLRAIIPIPLPDPPPDAAGLESFVRDLGTALQAAPSKGVSREPLMAMSDESVAARLDLGLAQLIPAWPWRPVRDCAPDILLRATQACGGTVHVIYEESYSQTRWNAPTEVDVTIIANDKACCIPMCADPDCDDCFKFTDVGSTVVANIGGNNPLAPVAPELQGLAGPGGADVAFAGILPIYGTVGSMPDLDYYEFEASVDGGPWAPLPAATLLPLSKYFWGIPCGGGVPQWNPVSVPPEAIPDTSAAVHHVYKTLARIQSECPGAPWEDPNQSSSRWWNANRNLALMWETASVGNPPPALTSQTTFVETPLVADGLYDLRIVGWKKDVNGKLIDRRVLLRCNTVQPERLRLRLDNRTVIDHPAFVPDHPWGPGYVHIGSVDPDCDFVQIVRNQGSPDQLVVDACSVVDLHDKDTLSVTFRVTVPPGDKDRHLGGYWMTVHHGESAYFDALTAGTLSAAAGVHPGPTYAAALGQGEVRRWWGGGEFILTVPGSAFEETCAYLFRLHAYKRVFNGSAPVEYFHTNDAEFSFTINKV